MKILSIVIGFLLMALVVLAEPIYTEGISYQVEVLEDGQIQVRKAVRIYRDGVEVGKTYHRHVLVPGDDTTKEVQRVKDIANVVWTTEVIAKYSASIIE